ncbi:MAG TPA: isoprenylcysteine carboxylmethyltransferase family protein, partial [Longimicrobiales bacterium]|nr:isoprenylcysteine carboxylmethyltransferase family protein [Longimicrobiales bacterium]
MRRILAALYATLAYLAFLLPITYLVGFLADAGVPKTVDRGAGPLGPSLIVDVVLLLAFGLQHSVMARPAFKRRIRRWVPPALERSTYVLASGTVLGMLFWLWRPVPMVLWEVTGTPLEGLAWAGFVGGLGVAVWATFALSHPHLFGLPQATAWGLRRDPPRMVLRESLLYRLVRHPMTAGLLLLFWSTPRMSLGHAVFALGMTAYSLVATVLEERDLLRTFPERYGKYRERVPALLPPLRPGRLLPRRGGLGLELTLVAAAALLPLASLHRVSLVAPSPPDTDPPLERHTMV